jgi:hypothetical protein
LTAFGANGIRFDTEDAFAAIMDRRVRGNMSTARDISASLIHSTHGR